tara:strand:+ start:826 stop:1638 length:813 start_codon:yes stop_codon:yes gene_type:complete
MLDSIDHVLLRLQDLFFDKNIFFFILTIAPTIPTNLLFTPMKFIIPAKKLFKALLVAIAVLLLLNIFSIYLNINDKGNNPLHSFIIRLFDFNQEANVPTFFSSLLLLASSLLLLLITFYKKTRNRRYAGWLGLTLLFFFFTLDEAASIHEFFFTFFEGKPTLSGYPLYFSLCIFAIVLFLLGQIYVPFFKSLNRKLMNLMLISAIIYISGALGLEILSIETLDTNGVSFGYRLLYTAEETMEMIGLAVFIYTLNWYLSTKRQKVSISLTE